MSTIIGYGSKHSHEFKLTVNEVSTNVENNTSEINFSFTIYKSSYSWSGWNTITYTININGTTYTGTIPAYSAGSILTIRTGSQTIQHNDDGKKSINCSFSVNDPTGQSYTCGNASASDVVKLTTIARKSTINSFFGENIEDYFSVTYTSYYSKFTNKLRISIPNVKELEKFDYVSGTTFKLSDETIEYLYSYMKKSKTVLIGMVIETWNGSTKIGESVELTKTCYITDCDPQIENYNYLDTNSKTIEITNDNQKIIRHMSTLRINLTNLTSYKGAELSKCTVTINNITKSFSNISGTSIESTYLDFGTLDISEDTNAVITLTDTRGNYITKELKISIYDYTLLSINATVKRVQPTTGEVGIEFSGNYFNGSFGSINNELSINWKYREKGQNEWIDGGNISPVIKDNTFSNGNTVISLGKIFDYQKAYEFMLVVSDKLTTLEPTFPNSVPKGIPIFNWGEDFFNVNGTLKENGYSLPKYYLRNFTRSMASSNTNLDDPEINGLFEVRNTELDYTGTKPFSSFYPFLNLKTPDNIAMLQIAGLNGNLYYRGKQTANVTMSGVSWAKIRDTVNWGVSLYDNSSGTTGTVTLSQSAANFTYIDLFFYNNLSTTYSYGHARIYNPNGKKAVFSNVNYVDDALQVSFANWTFSGTTLSVGGERYFNVKTSGTAVAWEVAVTRHNYLVKVVGYK